MEINLQNILEYQNDKVISRYQLQYPHSVIPANKVFSELMKYIWLSRKHSFDKQQFPNNDSLNFKCVIHMEMEEIDNMWHTFLLFTRDYQEFCNNYLNGIFFHHDPLPPPQSKISKKSYKKELNRYLAYIYENLGEVTLKTWFKE